MAGAFDGGAFDAGAFDVGVAVVVGGITQPIGSFSAYQVRDTTTPTGNPAYPWNLFRGQVIGVTAERVDSLLRLTLQLSDYNRLWSAMKLGAPEEWNRRVDPDGTIVAIDGSATNAGGIGTDGDATVFRYQVTHYWPISPYAPFPGLTTHVHQTNPDYSGLPVIDWTTALSDLGAFLTEIASRQSGATRFWIDADHEMHWTTVGPTPFEIDNRVPAPFEIDMDGPVQSGNVIQAMSLTAAADHSNLRKRAYVRGGTPESSLWVIKDDIFVSPDAGEEYIDAPGAVTRDDALRIADWWFRWNFRTLITGSAHISANNPEAEDWEAHDGWRVGQSGMFSDDTLSRHASLPLDRYEAVITGVQGRLVSPGEGLGIEIDQNVPPIDFGARVTHWESLTWTEKGFGEAGSATLTIEIVDPDEEVQIRPLADVRIFTDGTAAIEYDLEWGDIVGGTLSSQLAKLAMPGPEFKPPAYKVIWTMDKLFLLVDGETNIYGQLSDQSNQPVPLPGVPIEVELLQWTDLTETVVGSGFILVSSGTDIGLLTTNAAGQVYDIVHRNAGDATVYEPNGQALPIP